jgi:hypothetical protein
MGKGGGGGNQDNTTQVRPPSFAVPALNQAVEGALDLYNQGPYSFFPGQTFADFDPLQQQAQSAALAYGMSPALGNQLGAIGQANLSALSGPDNLLSNPAVQAGLGSIESRANRNLLENILPNVRRSAVGAGQTFGSSAQDVLQAQQIGDIQQRISDAQGTFLANQLDSARQQQARALGLAPQTLGTGLFPSQIAGDVGAQRQSLAQQGINEDIQRYMFNQEAQANLVNQLVNQSAGLAGFGGTTTSNYDQPGSNPLLSAVGGGLTGGALGQALTASGAFGFTPLTAPLAIGGALLGGLFG